MTYHTITEAAELLGCPRGSLYPHRKAPCPKCKGDADDCPRCRGYGTKMPTVRRYGKFLVPDWVVRILRREIEVKQYPQDLPPGIVIVPPVLDIGKLYYICQNDDYIGAVKNHTGRQWKYGVGGPTTCWLNEKRGPTFSSRNRAIRGLLARLGIE